MILKSIIEFYKVSKPKLVNWNSPKEQQKKMTYYKWATFLSATLGYGLYYVCRLSLNVVKNRLWKKVYFLKQN